jgi:ATP-dependent DNA helicase RecG
MSFSRYNSRLTLEIIQSSPENLYLERKGRDLKHTKIAEEIIGMLNANGGVIAYGVHDNGTIEDLNELTPETLDHYRKVTHDLIKPPAIVELEEITLEQGELIFLYHINIDAERLFMRTDNENVFLRVAESNKGPLSREEVKKLEYNKHARSYEDELRDDFQSEDLREPLCNFYLKKMNYEGSFEDLAIKRSIAINNNGTVIYKNAAILLFCTDPTKYIPNASVHYVRYEGVARKSGSKYNVIKDERFEEPIPRLIEILDRFVSATLRDYYFLNLDSGKFEKVPEYPKEAWLEGIVNALCHRSYNLQGNAIYIRHYDDRMEIANSGPLPAQVTVENIQQQRYSRNPRIARILSEMGYVRELNEGVPRIFSSMNQFALDDPEYQDDNDTVTLTLRNKVTNHKSTIHADTLNNIEKRLKSLSTNQTNIVNYLLGCCEATITDISKTIGISTQATRQNLNQLIEFDILERISEKQRDKNAIYRFKNK